MKRIINGLILTMIKDIVKIKRIPIQTDSKVMKSFEILQLEDAISSKISATNYQILPIQPVVMDYLRAILIGLILASHMMITEKYRHLISVQEE